MSTIRRTKIYAICPTCGENAGTVDHLLGRTLQTAWYCDSCGHRYHLTFAAGGVTIEKLEGSRKIKTMDLLILEPQQHPVYFVVPGMRFEDPHDKPTLEEQIDRDHHFYESHSCPTNWLKPEKVYYDGDDDPHGLIKFIASIDDSTLPADEPVGPNKRDEALLSFIEGKK